MIFSFQGRLEPLITSSAASDWAIPSAELLKYDQIFAGLQPINGKLTGDKVRPVSRKRISEQYLCSS